MKRKKASRARPRRRPASPPAGGEIVLPAERLEHPEASPRLSGGDVDADWEGAYATGEEGVGGSVATPDQDVVDELGEALGVPQAPDAEVRTSEEILRERDRHRWTLERQAEREQRRGRRA